MITIHTLVAFENEVKVAAIEKELGQLIETRGKSNRVT
jgi:hypothetical protein